MARAESRRLEARSLGTIRDTLPDIYAFHPAPLDECACCGYNLRGHGPQGVCPECGESYSEADCFVGVPLDLGSAPPHWSDLICAILLVAAGFLVVGNVVVATICVVAGCIALLPLVKRKLVGAERIAFRREGIVEYEESRRIREIPWDRVASIRATINGAVLVRMHGHVVSRSVFDGSREAALALRESIEMLRRNSAKHRASEAGPRSVQLRQR